MIKIDLKEFEDFLDNFEEEFVAKTKEDIKEKVEETYKKNKDSIEEIVITNDNKDIIKKEISTELEMTESEDGKLLNVEISSKSDLDVDDAVIKSNEIGQFKIDKTNKDMQDFLVKEKVVKDKDAFKSINYYPYGTKDNEIKMRNEIERKIVL